MRDMILDAQFEPAGELFTWISGVNHSEAGEPYDYWLLVHNATDRIIASIEGPTEQQLSYDVFFEDGSHRKFISREGAKRATLAKSEAYVAVVHAISTARAAFVAQSADQPDESGE